MLRFAMTHQVTFVCGNHRWRRANRLGGGRHRKADDQQDWEVVEHIDSAAAETLAGQQPLRHIVALLTAGMARASTAVRHEVRLPVP